MDIESGTWLGGFDVACFDVAGARLWAFGVGFHVLFATGLKH